jgi:Leucine-rich repeat (LRR) protein
MIARNISQALCSGNETLIKEAFITIRNNYPSMDLSEYHYLVDWVESSEDYFGEPTLEARWIHWCTKATSISVADDNKTDIPLLIGCLKSLHLFKAYLNKISNIPETIGNCTFLEKIDLSNNYLTNLPDTWSTLDNLSFLALNGNRIKQLPPSLADCSSLRKLNLRNNKISTIPNSFGSSSSLKIIMGCNNAFKEIPNGLSGMTSLFMLYFRENTIKNIDSSVSVLGKLPNLRGLDLSSCKISSIPSSLKRITQLKRLNLYGNPLPESEIAKAEELLPECTIITYPHSFIDPD